MEEEPEVEEELSSEPDWDLLSLLQPTAIRPTDARTAMDFRITRFLAIGVSFPDAPVWGGLNMSIIERGLKARSLR
jgi:hypothetical protein